MKRFLIRRFIFGIISIIMATFFVLILSRGSGDPLLLYANSGYGLTAESEKLLRKELRLDKHVIIQYFYWLRSTLQGDMGVTILDRKPVARIVFQKLPSTLQLAAVSWVLATIVGVPLGVLSAVRRATFLDYFGRSFALLGQAVPQFWLGLVFILIFAVYLDWLPAGLKGESFWDIKYLVLPCITLAWGAMAGYLRLTRTAMLEVLDSEYIRLARAKGVANSIVVWKHAFRNALIQPLTASTLILSGFLTGAVLVETIFAWPGMGDAAIRAVNNNDFPLLQGFVFFFTILFVATTFITDILYAYIDPRIRYD
jgi:peptide/nickel transport system permease protein